MYIINNRNEIDTFIRNVFNYYNGRINLINPARLHIEWLQCNNINTAGAALLPNIVEIYPNVMCRIVNNEEQLKRWIVMVVIHELYHTDQIIDTTLLMCDTNYENYIENAVEVMTTIYIANHREEIYNTFGVLVSDNNNLKEYMYNYISGSGNYRRKNLVQHIFLCLSDAIRLESFINELFHIYYKYIESDKNILLFVARDKYIYIKEQNNLIDINLFNDFMYYNYFRFTFRKTKMDYFEEDNELHICIGFSGFNNMIDIIL